MNQMPYTEARKLVTHPVACIDCHDPETMQLRVTRPGFIEGIRALKASQGVQDYDVNTQAHARRRCARSSAGSATSSTTSRAPEKRLDLSRGRRGSRSRTSSPTTTRSASRTGRTPRPARRCSRRSTPSSRCGTRASTRARGVACADCHMPYMREGALKISDHHVRSPLLNINRACQTCHKWSEDELRNRALHACRSARSTCATSRWTRSSRSSPTSKAARGAGRTDDAAAGPRGSCSARRSSCSTSSRPRTRRASTRRRRPRASSARPIDFARQGQVLLRDPSFKPQHAPGGMGEPVPPSERGQPGRTDGAMAAAPPAPSTVSPHPAGNRLLQGRGAVGSPLKATRGVAAVGDLHFGKSSQGTFQSLFGQISQTVPRCCCSAATSPTTGRPRRRGRSPRSLRAPPHPDARRARQPRLPRGQGGRVTASCATPA